MPRMQHCVAHLEEGYYLPKPGLALCEVGAKQLRSATDGARMQHVVHRDQKVAIPQDTTDSN
jgi:hypothetical protein